MLTRFNSVHKNLESSLDEPSRQERETIEQYLRRSHDLWNFGYNSNEGAIQMNEAIFVVR